MSLFRRRNRGLFDILLGPPPVVIPFAKPYVQIIRNPYREQAIQHVKCEDCGKTVVSDGRPVRCLHKLEDPSCES